MGVNIYHTYETSGLIVYFGMKSASMTPISSLFGTNLVAFATKT